MAFALQNIPNPQPGSTTTSVPTDTSGGAAAPAQEPGLLGSPLFFLIMFVPLMAMMFWSSRSQKKQQEKMLAGLKKGDTVLTQSGLRGKLVELGDRFYKVEIAPGTKVEILRTSVLGKDGAEAAAQLEKK